MLLLHHNKSMLLSLTAMAKRLMREGMEASLPTALDMEMDSTALLFMTEDKDEGIQAFIEKRAPQFNGQ